MAFVIAAIEGELISVGGQSALIRSGAMTYEVLIPAADAPALAGVIGSNVNFVTLHYLESQGQGSSFWPRLIGFQSVSDRDFFELLTSVKGIGNRKALRALQRSFADIAAMIEQKDFAALQSLPEIGRKTAETIVVELKDKVARFTLGATNPARVWLTFKHALRNDHGGWQWHTTLAHESQGSTKAAPPIYWRQKSFGNHRRAPRGNCSGRA